MTGTGALLAKSASQHPPAGESLPSHLQATLAAADLLSERVGKVSALPERFWAWVLLAALLHDAGKAADGCQVMLGGGPNWKERHEVLSLGFAARLLAGLPDEDLLWISTGIITHHRPLSYAPGKAIFHLYGGGTADELTRRIGDIDAGKAQGLLAWLDRTARSAHHLKTQPPPLTTDGLSAAAHGVLEELWNAWGGECDEADGLTGVLLQGAVTLADHLSSAGGDLITDQPADSRLAKAVTAAYPLRTHQEHCARTLGHLLLLSPTGSGKTEAALLWAAAQVEDMRAANRGQPRIFYTLPYLASINAMAGRLTELIGEDYIGISHSRAASYHLARSLCGADSAAEAAEAAVARQAATRLFREPVRVGTPYQLLRGALAGPAHSSILADSANSVFILDELHAYDAGRFGMILAMAAFWARIGGRIAVTSATLPTPAAELLQETLHTVTTVEARHETWPARHRLQLRSQHLTSQQAADEITARLHAGQAVLVVANNVADALTLYDRLAPVARELHGSDAAVLLHARYRTSDRTAIENHILSRYKPRQPHQPGLVIATQVVEVSLNVDFDAIHTSGAPLEPLLQRFGRVNRLGSRPPADVVVHAPHYKHRKENQADLWADYVYEAKPTALTMAILARHDGQPVSEAQAATWLDEIYASPWGTRWRNAVAAARDDFTTSFLQFTAPFDDRTKLADAFDKMFNGTDAILSRDSSDYKKALNSVKGEAGRLLGSQYLIPLPSSSRIPTRYDRELGLAVIDASIDYTPETGLATHRNHATRHLDELP
jgi:CRISPR-associated helicase Cas3/CRISPR-associated endonuclease Cas3-HD